MNNNKKIGILCWEEGKIPKAIAKIASLKGSTTNKESYDFPVLLKRVKGANAETIVLNPSEEVLNKMIFAMESMINEDNVCAIATSCGFNAIHQARLAEAVNVPVFTSSLMQVPFVKRMLKKDQCIGILTARAQSLTKMHFSEVGVTNDIALDVAGVENLPEWGKLLKTSDEEEIDIDISKIESEICSLSIEMIKKNPQIGAFVLECTDMPPFSSQIRAITKLPVFDFITMAHYVYSSL